jgi:MFS family permease
MIPLAYALYNFTQALFAIPIGKFSDKWGKPTLLSIVYLAFGLGTLTMASGSTWGVWLGFAIYGFFAGGFNALAKAIISDTAPYNLKATAYGVYYTAVDIATLISLASGGWLWDNYGSTIPFIIASGTAILLSGILFKMRKRFTSKEN